MTITTEMVVVAAMFFVLGWVAHIGWDLLVEALFGAIDGARSILVDVFAVIGAVAVAVLVGYLVTN